MTRRRNPGRLAATMADNAMRTYELGTAAQAVVGARMAMGLQAAHQPRLAHLEEAARMTGEKVLAFGEAAAAGAPGAARIGQRVAAAGLAEASAAMAAGLAASRASTPAAAAGVGARYASDAMVRAVGVWSSLAGAALGVQSAMLTPLHRTATGNARRLKGR